ncbi:hypothetical protein [Mucilaginibacter sp.]|uniref:hypothetical protein n=1 Tax=Mucilaginibacter sp. TaxID=1882438 RepID=UPI0026234296|nr:hypothetical protein [Mucilaginibacter sp.]MDB5032305.1 hypothetical protein [Mucilaginibacter sp.]
MKPALLLFFFIVSAHALAQETSVAGIVFDTESKDRLSRVNILNLNTHISVYDNLNGVFTIDAKPGDQLVFSQKEHFADTIKVQSYIPLAIYLKRMAIQLKEVTIFDTLMDPQKRLLATKRDFSKAYGPLANRDLLNFGPSGAGLGIDALYNIFSRSGRNAAHLRETIEEDYKQDIIDYRFNKTLVGRVTGLKDKRLADFMLKYRPGYYLVANSTEYDFILSIRTNYRRYLRNPGAHALAPLYPPKVNAASPAKKE